MGTAARYCLRLSLQSPRPQQQLNLDRAKAPTTPTPPLLRRGPPLQRREPPQRRGVPTRPSSGTRSGEGGPSLHGRARCAGLRPLASKGGRRPRLAYWTTPTRTAAWGLCSLRCATSAVLGPRSVSLPQRSGLGGRRGARTTRRLARMSRGFRQACMHCWSADTAKALAVGLRSTLSKAAPRTRTARPVGLAGRHQRAEERRRRAAWQQMAQRRAPPLCLSRSCRWSRCG